MAVIYNAAVKTARMTATRDYFANGTLEVLSAADAVLGVWGLSGTGGSVTGTVWTLAFDANTVAAVAAGTAAKAQLKTAGGLAHLTGLTVGLSGADVNLDNLSFALGQNVTMSSGTFTHA